jgi:BlaI family transcriptional regulator, penicillinase repressor
MAKRPEPNLTGVQLEIMNLFWEQGELGVAQVWKLLAARRPIARNTVQTMLTRLADKGWLRARAEGNAFYYRSTRPRKFAVTGMLGDLLDTAFAGSATGLVAALLEDRRISREDARRIRELIDRAQQETR